MQDGFIKKKGVRKESSRIKNQFEEIKEELKMFIKDQSIIVEDVPEFKKVSLLDKEDKDCELVAESYIDSKIPSSEEIEGGIEELIREAVAFKIKYHDKLKEEKVKQ